MPKPLFGLAKKIFDMKNSGAKVPANVLAAARNVMLRKETESDRQLIYNAVGAKKTGAKAYTRALKSLNSPLDLATKYATLGTLISQGGATGVIGGMKMASETAADINRLAHQRWFKEAVGQVLGDALKGEHFANSMGAIARQAGMAVTTVGQAAAIVAGIVKFGEALGGMSDREGRRLAWSEHALARANPRLTARERQLAEMRFAHSENRADGFNALPLIGELGAKLTDTYSPAEIGRKETEVALQKTHLGGNVTVDSLREIAKKRYFEKTYGAFGGHLASKFNTSGKYFLPGIGEVLAASIEAGAEKGATEEANRALSRAQALKNAGFKYVEQGDFESAREQFRQANREVEGSAPMWKNPEAAYPAMIMAAEARRQWPRNFAPKRTRTGE